MFKPEIGMEYNLTPAPGETDRVYVAELPFDKYGRRCRYHEKYFSYLNGPDERGRLETWQEEQAAKMDAEMREIILEAETA
jgi:hypothetical protein